MKNQTEKIENCFAEQLRLHPSMIPQDAAKLCYQAVFGPHHLITDENKAEHSFMEEWEQTVPCKEIPFFESVSPAFLRLNFAPWKALGAPGEWIFRMFLQSAGKTERTPGEDLPFLQAAEKLKEVLSDTGASFSQKEWNDFLTDYLKKGIRPLHHSEAYRTGEKPAYRLVCASFLPLLGVLQECARLRRQKSPVVLFIDGRCASGKTTFAETLSGILPASVVHMDDFYLPKALRDGSFGQAGGNIHFQRFQEEISPHLHTGNAFSYRVFDCHTQTYSEERRLAPFEFLLVEGSYSHHPLISGEADLRIFLTVSPEEQKRRILRRNGPEGLRAFESLWIPREEAYFSETGIEETADFLLKI